MHPVNTPPTPMKRVAMLAVATALCFAMATVVRVRSDGGHHLAPLAVAETPFVEVLTPAPNSAWDASDGAGVLAAFIATQPADDCVKIELIEERDDRPPVSVTILAPSAGGMLNDSLASLAALPGFAFHGVAEVESRMGLASAMQHASLAMLSSSSAPVPPPPPNGSIVYEPFATGTVRVRVQYVDASTGETRVMDVHGVRMFRSLDTHVDECSNRGSRWLARCTCVPGAFGPTCNHTSAAACGAEFCDAGHVCEPTVLGVFRCAAPGANDTDTSTTDGACLCENGGSCVGAHRGRDSRCSCLPGSFGSRCELSAHECSVIYCGGLMACTVPLAGMFECVSCRAHCSGRGECASGRCACDTGWHGPTCAAVQACPLGCGNIDGSHCDARGGGCTCAPGIFGPTCSQTAAQCAAACAARNPAYAAEGRVCSQTVNGSYSCELPPPVPCAPDRFGPACAISQAMCSVLHCAYRESGLVCAPGFLGQQPTCVSPARSAQSGCEMGGCACSSNVTCSAAECRNSVCSGNGTCFPVTVSPEYQGEAMCACDRGRFGPSCQYSDKDECTRHVCDSGTHCERNQLGRRGSCEPDDDGKWSTETIGLVAGLIAAVLLAGFSVTMYRRQRREDRYRGREEGESWRKD